MLPLTKLSKYRKYKYIRLYRIAFSHIPSHIPLSLSWKPKALAISLGPGHKPGPRPKCRRLMAISFGPEPWPKILNIRGCAWGKPAGRRKVLNPGLRGANPFYSHKNRSVTKSSSKCLPFCGKASGLGSGKLRSLIRDLVFR